MKLTIRILLMFMAIFILCPGCISISGIPGSKANSLNAELYIPKPTKTAVVVPLFGEVSENWVIDIEKALQNPRCSLVVLWIESPGGTVANTKLLTHRIQVLKKQYNINIAVYSKRLLTSGAYWFASVANSIILSPVAITGSIGVYISRYDMTKLDSLWGIQWYFIRSGNLKTMGNPHLEPTQMEFMIWAQFVQKAYRDFLDVIWTSRTDALFDGYIHTYCVADSTPPDSLTVKTYLIQLADGRIYSAEDAFMYGLVDDVMYFDEFINALQLDRYIVVTIEGKVINDFYPFSSKENSKKKINKKFGIIFKQIRRIN